MISPHYLRYSISLRQNNSSNVVYFTGLTFHVSSLALRSTRARLRLSDMGLTTLSRSAFDLESGASKLASLVELDLTGNPLVCDCELSWLRHLNNKSHGAVCDLPEKYSGLGLLQIAEGDLGKCKQGAGGATRDKEDSFLLVFRSVEDKVGLV